jgi:hypothetical protein
LRFVDSRLVTFSSEKQASVGVRDPIGSALDWLSLPIRLEFQLLRREASPFLQGAGPCMPVN